MEKVETVEIEPSEYLDYACRSYQQQQDDADAAWHDWHAGSERCVMEHGEAWPVIEFWIEEEVQDD